MALIIWIIHILNSQGTYGQSYPAVYFQNDGNPSTNSYVYLNGTLPSMDQFSICLHLRLIHARGFDIPLMSYAVGSYSDEVSLTINVVDGAIGLNCCKGKGRYKSPPINSLETMLTWLHACIVLDLRKGNIILFINDKILHGKIKILSGEPLKTLPGGRLVLGQEQDVVLGGFTLFQSFEGHIAGYTLINQLLDENTMNNFMRCGEVQFPDILASFDTIDIEWSKIGAVEVTQIPIDEVCSKDNYFSVVFPEQRSFDDAFRLCRILKGEVRVPLNEKENLELVNNTKRFITECSSEYGIYMWIGIKVEEINGTSTMYSDRRNLPLKYSNFRPGFSNLFEEYKCVFMDKHIIGMWAVYPCDLHSCVTCGFNNTGRLRLRGLCPNSYLDNIYFINNYYNGKPKFEGIRQTKIIWTNTTWIITNPTQNETIGIMESEKVDQYPIGLRKWNITGDICPIKEKMLLLTSCSSKQFTCNDGTCIPKIQRCDLEIQCPDRSDEIRCSPVVVPKDYIKEVPPPKFGTAPAAVSFFVHIITLYPVKVLESRAYMEMLVTLQWRDTRLHMESLNYAEDMNLISNGEYIWVPSYVIEDNTGSEANSKLSWQTFVAVMESGPEPDDISRVKEDEVYSGTRNSLKITQAYSINFFCKMNLAPYPFDTQYCSVIIRLKDIGQHFVVLQMQGEGISYNGSKFLREYEVSETKIEKYNKGNFSAYRITLVLDNLSGFYVFSTYIPTFLMVIICYLTFYFDLHDFNDRIMVSLTALLVLATLFTQITETTPSTAYLKLLDVWFVSCIFINFLIVVNLVVINRIRIKEKEEEEKEQKFTPVLKYKRKSIYPRKKEGRAKRMNNMAIIYVPILVATFAICYIVISLTFVL